MRSDNAPVLIRGRLLGLLGLCVGMAGCTDSRLHPAGASGRTSSSPAMAAASAAQVPTATCTVRAESPGGMEPGRRFTCRNVASWRVQNPTATAVQVTVILEIRDDRGHEKRKAIPAELQPRSQAEDSTWITLMATYPETGRVGVQARITIRWAGVVLAEDQDSTAFPVP